VFKKHLEMKFLAMLMKFLTAFKNVCHLHLRQGLGGILGFEEP
jgi:hypothetical protein